MDYNTLKQQLKVANEHLENQGHQFRLAFMAQDKFQKITIEYGTKEQLDNGRIAGRLTGKLSRPQAFIILEGILGILGLFQTYTFVKNGMEGAETNIEKIKKDKAKITPEI